MSKLIHEVNNVRQHRLIIMKGEIPVASDWVDLHLVGNFKGYFFHAGSLGPAFPTVFSVRSAAHETLR